MIETATILFPILHGLGLSGFLTALGLAIGQKPVAAAYAFLAGMGGLLLNWGLIIVAAQRLPLYGMFESMTTILLIAGGCLFFDRKKRAGADTIGYGFMALLSGCLFLFPLGLNHDFFLYKSPWVQCFFFFRLLSAGVLFFAGIRFTVALTDAIAPANRMAYAKQQARLLLAGTVLFLLSEFSGSVWCLKGWGDSWRWSENFFQSAAIFFLIMLNLHIPLHLLHHRRARTALGALSSFAVVFLFLW